ncbi:MAG: hypothetical protein K8T20_17535 [Planctomycetes bacterium]|nr:hypothetical protein [Planctomycetota bacterium]
MRRDAGLTVIEAAVLCFIVLAVIALLLPIPPGDRCRSRHSASQATIWASGCGDAPACDAATSEPADKATLKNW